MRSSTVDTCQLTSWQAVAGSFQVKVVERWLLWFLAGFHGRP